MLRGLAAKNNQEELRQPYLSAHLFATSGSAAHRAFRAFQYFSLVSVLSLFITKEDMQLGGSPSSDAPSATSLLICEEKI